MEHQNDKEEDIMLDENVKGHDPETRADIYLNLNILFWKHTISYEGPDTVFEYNIQKYIDHFFLNIRYWVP